MIYTIHTDGACLKNPGKGGWAASWIHDSQHRLTIGGYETWTTNNRMELQAVIGALSYFSNPVNIHLFTDSQYVQKGITEYMPGWKQRNWTTSTKQAVKNQDLWVKLDILNQTHRVQWSWVRGHDGDAQNEHVDRIARWCATHQMDFFEST